jgi:hypothetical protein
MGEIRKGRGLKSKSQNPNSNECRKGTDFHGLEFGFWDLDFLI